MQPTPENNNSYFGQGFYSPLSYVEGRIGNLGRRSDQFRVFHLKDATILIEPRLRSLVFIPQDQNGLSLKLLMEETGTHIELGTCSLPMAEDLSTLPSMHSSILIVCGKQSNRLKSPYVARRSQAVAIHYEQIEATIRKILSQIQAVQNL